MNEQITIREAVTERDIAAFWAQFYAYYHRDAFPDQEDREQEDYLSETDYRTHMERLHERPQDPCRYLFFHREGQDIGFALVVIFTSEDGKCFVLDFCVSPEYRGGGTGRACARALLDWAKERGGTYAELNYGEDERRLRFWNSVGFVPNGANEWGDPMLTYPPTEAVPIIVERLTDPEDWQLAKLENGFLREIGEAPLTAEKLERLRAAIDAGAITFFLAKRGYRAVGMCSVARCFSTFSCGETGVFDDFFVEPVFRKQGVARRLAQAAQEWCRAQNLASLTVTCAPCDEEMYQALGFEAPLGSTYASVM